jgi:hypothetical protein
MEIVRKPALGTWMKFIILVTLVIVVGCAPRPTLEQLEDEANVTGDWAAVEHREELVKKHLEATAPGCPVGQSEKCVEEQTGIQCYCLPSAKFHN